MSDQVEIIDDEGADPPEKTNGAARKPISADDMAQLRQDLADAKAARSEAATRAQRAEQERDEARGQQVNETGRRWQAEAEALDTSATSLTSEQDALEDRYASLVEAGQFKDAAKVQRRMAEAAAELQQIKQRKIWLEEAKEIEKQQRERAPQPAARADGEIDLTGYTPRQRRWIRDDHPEYLTDSRFRAKVAAAHYDALGEGLTIDTPEYFDHIEGMVAKKPPARQEVEEDDDPPPQPRRRASPELAVERRTPATPRQGDAPRLTADEVEAADITLAHLPVNDVKLADGTVQFGRYRQYAEYKKDLRGRGVIN